MALGDIGAALLDSLALSCICDVTEGDVAHVLDEWFVVAYYENGTTDVIVSTFSVDNCGNIPCAVQDTMTLSAATGSVPSLQKITDGIFGIAYLSNSGACGDHTVATYAVDSCGNFAACDATIDTLVISESFPGPRVHLEPTKWSDIFILFSGAGTAHLKSFTIDTSGNIGTVLDTFNHVFSPAHPVLVWTGKGDYHAFTHANKFVDTVEISSTGVMPATHADVIAFDNNAVGEPSISSNDDGILTIYAQGASSQGRVYTLSVDDCGQLANIANTQVSGISGEKTTILRIDEIGDKNIFLGASNSSFDSWSFDSCGNITVIDDLNSITQINDHPAIQFLPSSGNIIVGSGYQVSCQEFFVYAFTAESNIDAAADTSDPHGGNAGKLLGIFYG